MQVAKWGNSLAVRLPAALVRELGIADGDEIQLWAAPRQPLQGSPTLMVVRQSNQPSKLERLQAMRRLRAAWPSDFVFNREEANQR